MTIQTPNNSAYQLLVVDDDSTIRDNLREYLTHYHQANYRLFVDEAATAEEALSKIEQNPYDLLICDINLPDNDGFFILKEADRFRPAMKKALITAYDLDSYIQMAQQESVYNIIIKTAPFNFPEFSAVVDNLLNPETAFGLDKYLKQHEPLKQIVVTSSEQIMPAQQELHQFFAQFDLPDLDALSIAMVEAITNAVYHSAKNPDGTFRYQKGEVIQKLEPHEEVIITYGHDDEKLGISIRDQGGTMTADEILYWLERNISGKSLLDTHGRGIYLIYRLMDRLVINLAPKCNTELILLHYVHETSQDNKPIFINELH